MATVFFSNSIFVCGMHVCEDMFPCGTHAREALVLQSNKVIYSFVPIMGSLEEQSQLELICDTYTLYIVIYAILK